MEIQGTPTNSQVRETTTRPSDQQGKLTVAGRHYNVSVVNENSDVTKPVQQSFKAINDFFARTSLNAQEGVSIGELDQLSYMEKYHVVKETIGLEINTSFEKDQAALDKHFASVAKTYLDRRHSFAFKGADLVLHPTYESERVEPHIHPVSHKPVRYVRDASNQKITFQEGSVDRITNLDGSSTLPKEAYEVMFVRSNSMESIRKPQTYVTENMDTMEEGEKKKTQHSSFKRGESVVSAGTLEFDRNNRLKRVNGESGHYRPDEESLYKFAEFGAQTGQFEPETIKWKQYNPEIPEYTELKMSQADRMKAVLAWAKRNPKSD